MPRYQLGRTPWAFAAICALLLAGPSLAGDGTSLWERSTFTGDWYGSRTRLEDRGVSVAFVTTSEFMRNVQGGAGVGTASLDNEDLQLTVDADKLMHWPGAQLFVYGLRDFGHSPSQYVGDAQVVSNIDAPNTTKLFEAWLDQSFGSEASLRVGLYNVNSEFDAKELAKPFLNSSHGMGKDWSQAGVNGPSIFPTTSLGARVKLTPTEQWSMLMYAGDGSSGDPANPYGTHVKLDWADGMLLASEVAWKLPAPEDAASPLRVGAGAWRFTGRFDHRLEQDGSGAPLSIRGNEGAYAFSEGLLWHAGARSLAGYVRGGVADARVNPFGSFAAGGVVADGWVPFRSQDRLALGVAVAWLGGAELDALRAGGGSPANAEKALEATWHVRLAPWITLQPDLQYVLDPGADRNAKAAVVLGLRTAVAY